MRKAKRSGGDLYRNEWISGCLLGDSNPDVWTGLSDGLKSYLSKSVASIAVFNGDDILFSCSSIAMEQQGPHITRFLTTAGLVRALDATTEHHNDVKLRVRHEGTELYKGFVAACDMDHNFAVVNVYGFLDVQFGPLQCALEILPHGEVLAVGRGVSGNTRAKIVELNGDSWVSKNDKDLRSKISEPWEGGPLLSFDGNMVGMNLFLTKRKAVFLPWGTLKHYMTPQLKVTGLAQSKKLKVHRHGARPIGEKSYSHQEDFLNQEQLDLDSDGYPKLPSTMLGAPVKLVYSFEDPFGDIYGEGVWKRFNKGASNLDRNVVALASFNGEKRFFACTGIFIKWSGSTVVLTSASLVRKSGDENEIDEDLTIQVRHDGQYKKGKLHRCNLHYNVALVCVKNYRDLRPSNTLLDWESSFEVAAVGRFFKSGKLMATSGYLVSWTGTLDCEFISRSTCKIKKAGIGGPLVNLDGDVIGMNFYDTRIGTPFLFWGDICKILASFETKSEPGDVGNTFGRLFWKMPSDDKDKVNRWPVPTARWWFLEDVESDDDELVIDPKSGRIKYGYTMGQRVILL